MTEHTESHSSPTQREQELELEVARLQAELDTLRGEDAAVVTARLLSMAADTADRTVAEARREADEIVDEISAEAEARRDEATRVAAEAEAMAEQMLAEADKAQETVDRANEAATAITAAAEEEAAQIVAAEREMLVAEAEAFAEVRSALDQEREALRSYHDSLRERVQELASSMVTFMDTELPSPTAGALEGVTIPEIVVPESPVADSPFSAIDTPEIDTPEIDTAEDSAESDFDPLDTPAPVAGASDDTSLDPWVEMLEAAIPEEDRILDMPDTAIDEIPAGPPSTFDGVPVQESEDDDEALGESLFSRSRHDDDDADRDEGDAPRRVGLFGMFGSRLVEQTAPDELAEALEADDSEDQAFRQFIDGDDAPDASRDWLLRPEQS